jgi:methanogenic corrinoid protein MtbC1
MSALNTLIFGGDRMEARSMTQALARFLIELDDTNTLEMVRDQLQAGQDPQEIVEQCRIGITEVGEFFARGEYFLSELIVAADIFEQSMALIDPHLEAGKVGGSLGTVVMGTVKGDIHNLGKDIVVSLLRCEGFAVVDLGTDVPPERFVEALSETGATILGMSCLMTTAFDSMKAAVETIEQAGMRNRVYVVIGGGPVDDRVRDYVGADFCATDAVKGVRACHRYVEEAG